MSNQPDLASKMKRLYKNAEEGANVGDNEDDVCTLARERSRDGATYWKENWERGERSLNYINGDQWNEQVKTERELDQRPCLTNNVLPTFVDRVLGVQRQNKPSIKITASKPTLVPSQTKEGKQEALKIPSMNSDKQYTPAEVMQGIVRGIEYDCDAEDDYTVAFEAGVQSGLGYLRVRNDYVGEGFNQKAIIEAIANQFAVTMDPMCKRPDTSDKNWTLIDEEMMKVQFEKEYPDASPEPTNIAEGDVYDGWFSEKTVRVSEYYTREPVIKTKFFMSNGEEHYEEDIEAVIDELLEAGVTVEKTRKVKTYNVYWRKINGNNVLEGPIKMNCDVIPVFPMFGKPLRIKKKVYYRSLVHNSLDAQDMSNYWDSAATEAVALAPKAPFTGTEDQIEGYEEEWKTHNTKNYGMLPYVSTFQGDKGPQRQQPAPVPTAQIVLGQSSTDTIKATMGIFDASIGAAGNETSGRAIRERNMQADTGSFAFIDNLSKCLRCIGRVLVQMIPAIMDNEQVAKMVFPDGSEDFVTINKVIVDEETGEETKIYDLGLTTYNVRVSTGPAYTTQRQEASESMMAFAKAVPEAAAVMADLIAQNQDWPGADEIAARLKKIIPPEVLTAAEREAMEEDKPEDEEPKPPTPAEEIQMKGLQVEDKKLDADLAQANADIAGAEADTAKAEAEMAKVNFESQAAQTELQLLEKMAAGGNETAQMFKEMIAEAMAQVTTPE